MRKISEQARKNIIAAYLNGMTYDEIAASLGISKGAISGIVDEVREGRFPGLEDVLRPTLFDTDSGSESRII